MQRYFADIINQDVILSKDDIFHITKVMRAKLNDYIQVVDKSSHQTYLAFISSLNPFRATIQEPINEDVEITANITLFFALAKSDKIEFVIQKSTELGVKNIVLFQGKRSVVKFTDNDFIRKLDRYKSIAKEASEQCHRQLIPTISYVDNIKKINNHLCDINFFAYELEAGQASELASQIKDKKSISLIIGPEGGFDEKEAEYLKELKFVPISLGKRILRCETAAVYGLSVISYLLEK